MEQDPLVRLGDAEDVTGLPRFEPLHVAHGDHGPLPRREGLDGAGDHAHGLVRHQPVLGDAVPRPGEAGPASRPRVARREEPVRIDGGLIWPRVEQRGERDAPPLSLAPGDGPVRQDAEDPRLQRRTPLEPVEALQHGQPGLLDHLVGHGRGGDERPGKAAHGSGELVDQPGEGALVATPQGVEQRGLVARLGQEVPPTCGGRTIPQARPAARPPPIAPFGFRPRARTMGRTSRGVGTRDRGEPHRGDPPARGGRVTTRAGGGSRRSELAVGEPTLLLFVFLRRDDSGDAARRRAPVFAQAERFARTYGLAPVPDEDWPLPHFAPLMDGSEPAPGAPNAGLIRLLRDDQPGPGSAGSEAYRGFYECLVYSVQDALVLQIVIARLDSWRGSLQAGFEELTGLLRRGFD